MPVAQRFSSEDTKGAKSSSLSGNYKVESTGVRSTLTGNFPRKEPTVPLSSGLPVKSANSKQHETKLYRSQAPHLCTEPFQVGGLKGLCAQSWGNDQCAKYRHQECIKDSLYADCSHSALMQQPQQGKH